MGVGRACLLKEPLHLYRVRALPAMRSGVATLPLPDPKGTGTGCVCLDNKTISILHIYFISTEYKIYLNWI